MGAGVCSVSLSALFLDSRVIVGVGGIGHVPATLMSSCASRILLVLNVPDSGGAPCIYGGVTLIWPVFLEVVCNLCLLYFSNVLATRKPSAQTTIGLRVRYCM